MKKILVVVGAVVGVVVAAAAVFWLGWMTPPDGAAVCENVVRIVASEKSLPDPLKARAKQECEVRVQPPKYGRLQWVKQMKCMRDASSKADLDGCSRRPS